MNDQKISEIEKLKKLSFKEKLEYLWEYYKLPALGIILLVSVIGSVAFSMITRVSPLFTCYTVNLHSSIPENFSTFQKDVAEQFNFEDTRHFLLDTTAIINWEDSGMSFEHIIKLSTHFAAAEIDTVIGDTGTLELFGQSGGLTNLQTQLPSDTYKKYEHKIISVKLSDSDEEIPCAVDISDSAFMDFINSPSDEPIYFAIPANSQNMELAEQFLDIIFSYSS
jgi:hypothetical protein